MARRRPGREEPADRAADASAGPPADPESVARTIVLTRLTSRARSRHELAEALAARAVPDDVATKVLDRFTAVGLVDDAAFAASWVESRRSTRGLSRRALAVELRRKGVADDVIDASLDDVDDEAEYAAARDLVERRVATARRSTRQLDPLRLRRQLVGLLGRRGYSTGLAFRAVDDVLGGLDTDPEPS